MSECWLQRLEKDNPATSALLLEYIAIHLAYEDKRRKDVILALSCCESPLEQKLLMAVILRYDAAPSVTPTNVFVGRLGLRSSREFSVAICPQRDVETLGGTYRADCFIALEGWDDIHDKLSCYLSVDIEVDGHDFHERTKEQAGRDKSRDRHMVAEGYAVLRYTGSEVHRDVDRVVNEIDELLRRRAFEILGN